MFKKGSLAFIIGIAGIIGGISIAGCNSKGSGVAPKTDTVTIQNMEFTPKNLTINKGDTVVWLNKGIVAHNVTDTLQKIASGDINVGSTWKMVPEKSFNYFCSIHPTMTAQITVSNK